MYSNLIHWGEIAYWAVICLIQEMKGEEPDCPDCWKCESMRVAILCLVAFVLTKLSMWLL